MKMRRDEKKIIMRGLASMVMLGIIDLDKFIIVMHNIEEDEDAEYIGTRSFFYGIIRSMRR